MTDAPPSTANFADAALALGVANRFVIGFAPVIAGARIAGPARCVRHFGSVDIFLEVLELAQAGEVLVVDNGGRDDEGCIGDLVTLEAAQAGLAGIVISGRHRDTQEIRAIGLPLFSGGACPTGPQRLDPRDDAAFGRARLGGAVVFDGEWVVADDDGLFIAAPGDWPRLLEAAAEIREREARQAEAMRRGRPLRDQLALREYVAARSADPAVNFRDHLRRRGGAVEV